MIKLTFYRGVQEIGGNIIPLEDEGKTFFSILAFPVDNTSCSMKDVMIKFYWRQTWERCRKHIFFVSVYLTLTSCQAYGWSMAVSTYSVPMNNTIKSKRWIFAVCITGSNILVFSVANCLKKKMTSGEYQKEREDCSPSVIPVVQNWCQSL